jgi:CPA1 family monovalent cation:H+ antiporter
MWEVLDFLLEGLLFILVGLGLPLALAARGVGTGTSLSSLLIAGSLVSAVVILMRLVWIFPATYTPRYVRRRFAGTHDSYPPWRGVLFSGWAGLRGAVSLVVALSIPFTTASGAPFPGRDIVIFLTFTVILVTLVGQGLTLKPLIRSLGLVPDREEELEEISARLQTARAALARLEEVGSKSSADDGDAPDSSETQEQRDNRNVTEQLRHRYTHRVHQYIGKSRGVGISESLDADEIEAESDNRLANSYQWLRKEMIDAERQQLIQLRDDDEISDDVLHRVERDLDLEEILLTAQPVPIAQ